MRFIRSRKSIVALGVAAGLLASTGVAFAYWSQSGAGTGSASTGTTTAVVVNQTSTATAMYPGMSPVTISGNFNNPNPGAVKVGSVTATLGTLPSGCVAADFTIGGSAVVNAEIASGSAVGAWAGLTIQMNDTSANQDACKVSTIPLVYALSAAS